MSSHAPVPSVSPESGGELPSPDHSPSTVTTITAIFASIFLLAGGSALQTTAVALRAGIEGFSPQAIGIMSAGYYAGMLGGSFMALLMIRNVGYVRTFAAFSSLASATSLAHVLVISPAWWTLFRLIHGLCIAIVLVVVESWLNASAPNTSRGRILSIYGIVFLAANGATQPLLAIFTPAQFNLFGITSILISLCVLPVGLTQVTGNARVTSISIRLGGMFRKSPLGASGVIVSGAVIGAHVSLTPRFAQILGLSDGSIGLFLLVVALGTIALQLPLGWISDHKDRRIALIVSSAVASVAAIAMTFAAGMGPYLLVVGFLIGGFMMPLYPLAIATVNDQLKTEEMIEAASALYVFYGVGSIAGPLLASVGMGRFGPATLFVTIAVVLLLYLSFGLLRLHLVPDFLVRGAKASYRTVPRTTQVSLALLRRPRPISKPKKPKPPKEVRPRKGRSGSGE
jgi:MFS family permease